MTISDIYQKSLFLSQFAESNPYCRMLEKRILSQSMIPPLPERYFPIKKRTALFSLVLLLCSQLSAFHLHADARLEAATNKTTTPADRLSATHTDENDGYWWASRHEEKLALARKGGWEIVFIGDSITQIWELAGCAVWEKYYAPRNALNLGFSGDCTQNVLWRLDHGEMDGLKPKVAVIMIGTNNAGGWNDPPEAVAAGTKAIIVRIQTQSPTTKILLLGIFPRSAKTDDPKRMSIDKTNELLTKFADGDKVTFLNINDKFLAPGGELTRDIMPDLLHPNEKGFGIWAEAMEPTLKKLLGE